MHFSGFSLCALFYVLRKSSGSFAIFAHQIARLGLGCWPLGTSDEIRSEPVADRFGRDIDGAVLRVALGALLGEALLRPRNTVPGIGEGAVPEHDLAGRDLDELIGDSDVAEFLFRPAADWIDRQCYVTCL